MRGGLELKSNTKECWRTTGASECSSLFPGRTVRVAKLKTHRVSERGGEEHLSDS